MLHVLRVVVPYILCHPQLTHLFKWCDPDTNGWKFRYNLHPCSGAGTSPHLHCNCILVMFLAVKLYFCNLNGRLLGQSNISQSTFTGFSQMQKPRPFTWSPRNFRHVPVVSNCVSVPRRLDCKLHGSAKHFKTPALAIFCYPSKRSRLFHCVLTLGTTWRVSVGKW